MKIAEDASFFLSRRHALFALAMSPLLLLLRFPERNDHPPPERTGMEDFVIVGGWVLLKDDLTEDIR